MPDGNWLGNGPDRPVEWGTYVCLPWLALTPFWVALGPLWPQTPLASTPLTSPQTHLTGPHTPMAILQINLAGPQTPLADPQSSLASPQTPWLALRPPGWP